MDKLKVFELEFCLFFEIFNVSDVFLDGGQR